MFAGAEDLPDLSVKSKGALPAWHSRHDAHSVGADTEISRDPTGKFPATGIACAPITTLVDFPSDTSTIVVRRFSQPTIAATRSFAGLLKNILPAAELHQAAAIQQRDALAEGVRLTAVRL